jgi:hypothetical protein
MCGFKKIGDPPAFANETGSQCTFKGKGAVSGEKVKDKSKWQGYCTWDPPLTFFIEAVSKKRKRNQDEPEKK